MSEQSRRLRVASVGAGYFSQFHLAGWRAIADAELVGLCDADPAALAQQAQRYGIARTFREADALLDATQPDLIDIVTPPATHAALVAAAVARRVPVVCQKPLAPTYAEAVAIVEAAEAAGVLWSCTRTSVSCRGTAKRSG